VEVHHIETYKVFVTNITTTTPIPHFRLRSTLNNLVSVQATYDTGADLFPDPACAGTWHGDSFTDEVDS